MASIVTAKEIAKYLRLTESTIYKLASTGELPGFRVGKSWRFDMDEILKRIKDERESRAGQGIRGASARRKTKRGIQDESRMHTLP
ncbi:MAG: helix-turn-helix domain-containing protein [Deltaproteobacteria bacterium]|jgi:excisionase family DNA binding protein